MRQQLWRRIVFFFKDAYWKIVLLSSCLLLSWGWYLSKQNHPIRASALIGIGTSMLAAMLVSFAGPENDATYREFLKLGVKDFYANRDAVPKDSWVDWLAKAQRQCVLFGISHGEWFKDDRFESALVNRLIEGVDIEIFFLNPNGNPAIKRQQEDLQADKTTDRIKSSIAELWEIRKKLTPEARARLKVYTYDVTPSLGVTWIDDWMIVTHYLAGVNNRTSPALCIVSSPKPRSPFSVYAKNVAKIRGKSEEVKDENVHEYSA